MEPAYTFSGSAAKRIIESVKKTEGKSVGETGGDALRRAQAPHWAKLTGVDLGGGKWAATAIAGGTWAAITGAPGWTSTNPIQVVGPPMKAGLIVLAFWAPYSGGYWEASGYQCVVQDRGDAYDSSPYIFEDSVMKEKLWVTTDGITWTREKRALITEVC